MACKRSSCSSSSSILETWEGFSNSMRGVGWRHGAGWGASHPHVTRVQSAGRAVSEWHRPSPGGPAGSSLPPCRPGHSYWPAHVSPPVTQSVRSRESSSQQVTRRSGTTSPRHRGATLRCGRSRPRYGSPLAPPAHRMPPPRSPHTLVY